MSGRNSLDVTAIVIAYNSADLIVQTIQKHESALSHLKYEVVIVDNDSADNTVELARATLKQGHVIANNDNRGYGHAANQGVAAARGRTTLILNDDVAFTRSMIDRLLEVIESDAKVGLVGPRIVDENGNAMPAARDEFPGVEEEWHLVVNRGGQRRDNSRYPTGNDPVDVAWLVGACVMGPTEILVSAGGFNPLFFIYGEDIDMAKRLATLGYRVVTVPHATCVHTGSVSTTAAFSDEARIRRRADARDIFYRLWYNKPTRMVINLRRAIGFQNQPSRLKYHLPKVFKDGGGLAKHRFPPPIVTIPSAEERGS